MMVDLGLLENVSARFIGHEPGEFDAEGIENIITIGESLLQHGRETPEVHLAIAKARMFLQWEDDDYLQALAHIDRCLQLDRMNEEAFDLKKDCLYNLYKEREDISYLILLLDNTLDKADAFRDKYRFTFQSEIKEREFDLAFSVNPGSRGLLFFRIGTYTSRRFNKKPFDTADLLHVSARAARLYPQDNFIMPLISQMYDLLTPEERRLYRSALPHVHFNDRGNVYPLSVSQLKRKVS